MKKALWVVEMWIPEIGAWEPTVGVTLNRAAGRAACASWQQRHPIHLFRLRRYVPDEAQP